MSWYWDEIGDRHSAKYATTTAVWISYLIAAANGPIAALSLTLGCCWSIPLPAKRAGRGGNSRVWR
jgi:hypothetical protein